MDVNSDLGSLHHVNGHTVADVMDVDTDSIFRVKRFWWASVLVFFGHWHKTAKGWGEDNELSSKLKINNNNSQTFPLGSGLLQLNTCVPHLKARPVIVVRSRVLTVMSTEVNAPGL
jgi:hypothetical protein